jgi:ABC-type sugar transport system permease subunit
MWLSYALSISGVILAVMGIWIYGLQKKEAYKFFYPAICLFVLFSLVPITYSVYVSFTNLKTGHLLERKDVITLFENEKMIVQNSELLTYEVFKNQKKYLLVLKKAQR